MPKAVKKSITSRRTTPIERRVAEYWKTMDDHVAAVTRYSVAEQKHWKACIVIFLRG
jgi:hypothetical protein